MKNRQRTNSICGGKSPMKNKMNRSIRVVLPVVMLFLLSCATTPKMQAPPSEELRTNLGRIGVVFGSFRPEVRFRTPTTKGATAWKGAGKGAAFVAKGMGSCSGGGWAAIGCGLAVLVGIPVGAIIGSIVGSAEGVSPEKWKETEDALKSYLATVNFQETMRERFLLVAREQTEYPFVLLEVQGPKALDEETTYGSLPRKDVDTILEISVRKCELRGLEDSIDPYLGLLMTVDIRLISIPDGHVIYTCNFVNDNWFTALKFSEWGINNAQPFREELDRAFPYIATEIVKAISRIQAPRNPQPLDVKEIE